MTWHVVCRTGRTDSFDVVKPLGDHVLDVSVDTPGQPASVHSTVAAVLNSHNIRPPAAADDLLRAAIAAYTADVRIPRRSAYDNWTRDIVLYLPVHELDKWQQGTLLFERLLSFLTGDRWTIRARPILGGYRAGRGPRPRRVYRLETSTVSLFSGGLDSFIGAIGAACAHGQVGLVGHHAAGSGPTSVAQNAALASLRRHYNARLTPFLQFWVSPRVGPDSASEITTRGRSILFLALGIAVASGLRDGRLIVPENGFISLNVPLTRSRLGSFSTRTTHPYLIALLRHLLDILEIPVAIMVPYRFSTKGEMMANCTDIAALARGLASTMSYAHPGVGRFEGAKNPNQHCGRCFACLIRRAAVAAVGPDQTSYAWSDIEQSLTADAGSDLRVVKMALARYAQTPPRIGDVLLPGPLSCTPEELAQYLAVFSRGLSEMRRFLLPPDPREAPYAPD